jgi:sigma-B regulation protein RsbU (phosphoserine phosphatase)
MKEHDQLISIKQDLSVARDIQQGILPKAFPPFPGRKDFDIYASMTAAKEVGGDFYDFFMIDNNRLGFVIGDVSGKGIPAAIFMAVSRTLIRATGLNGAPPGECLHYVNNLLCNESVSCMFVSVFYGVLNMKTGELEYANAGHNPPYILKNDGSLVRKLESTGDLLLGCFDDQPYNSKKIILHPNEGILLFTDGVTEAFNNKDVVYGDERLENLLSSMNGLTARGIINTIVDDVSLYTHDVPQSDDITLLSLKYLG